MSRFVVLTDLDGTLLETGTYDYGPARGALAGLRARGHLVIAVTSRTRAEVERLFAEIGIPAAGIIENGSAVFLADGGHTLDIRLGCTLDESLRALEKLRRALAVELRHLGEMDVTEVQRLTGLDEPAALLACRREHGVVIVPADGLPFARAAEAAARLGVRLIEGDRFWHLVGAGADKGRAVRVLRADMADDRGGRFIGLGNGPSDVGLLEAVDVPIVVPGTDGPHPALAGRGWTVAPLPGPAGWAAAVTAVLSSENARADHRGVADPRFPRQGS